MPPKLDGQWPSTWVLTSSCGIPNVNSRWARSKYVWFAWSLHILAADRVFSSAASPIVASSFRDFHESQERARMRDYALHLDVNSSGQFALYISSTYVGFSSDLWSSIDSTISMGFADSMGPRWILPSPLLSFCSGSESWDGSLVPAKYRVVRNLSEMRGKFLWSYRDPSLLPAFPLPTGVLSND